MASPAPLTMQPDVSIELDVVQAVLRRLHFQRIFFGNVAQFPQISMPEQRVIVEIDLRIEREQPPIGRRNKRIDLHQRSIGVEERLIQAGQELHRMIDLLAPSVQA